MKVNIPVYTVIKTISDAIDTAQGSIAENLGEAGLDYKGFIGEAYEAVEDDKASGEYIKDDITSEYYLKEIPKKMKKSALNDAFKGMEDRNNDWLARQIREENRILRNGTLSDLGAAHNVKCDARDIKKVHHVLHIKGQEEM